MTKQVELIMCLTFAQGHWSASTAESCPAPPVAAEQYYSTAGGENMTLNNHLVQLISPGVQGPQHTSKGAARWLNDIILAKPR